MNYLTKQDIQTISGAKMRKKIIPWLRSNGIPYIMDATGWPLVAESVLQAKLGAPTKKEPRINFA